MLGCFKGKPKDTTHSRRSTIYINPHDIDSGIQASVCLSAECIQAELRVSFVWWIRGSGWPFIWFHIPKSPNQGLPERLFPCVSINWAVLCDEIESEGASAVCVEPPRRGALRCCMDGEWGGGVRC